MCESEDINADNLSNFGTYQHSNHTKTFQDVY